MRGSLILLVLLGCDRRVSGPSLPSGTVIDRPHIKQAADSGSATTIATNTIISNTIISNTIISTTTNTSVPPCCGPDPDGCSHGVCNNGQCTLQVDPGLACGGQGGVCCPIPSGGGEAHCGVGATCAEPTCPAGKHFCGADRTACVECCGVSGPSGECASKTCNTTCSAGLCVPSDQGKLCAGDPCGTDTFSKCNAGTCTPGAAPLGCKGPVDCRTAETCDIQSLSCIPGDPLPSGSTCGGNGCFIGPGVCDAGGNCATPPMKDCSVGVAQCQQGSCNVASGQCQSSPASGSCALTDKCKLNPSCQGGACVGDDKPCTTDQICKVPTCDPTTGDCGVKDAADGISCGASDSCSDRQCQMGLCIAVPKCVTDDPCLVAVCDAETGACGTIPGEDGVSCDSNRCASAGRCVVGECLCPDDDARIGKLVRGKNGCGGSSALPVGVPTALVALYLLLRRRYRQG